MLHVLLCHSVPPDNIPLGDKCKASSPIPLGWLAPWVQPSHCLMHADSRRLRGKIWYHLHLIFISGGTWTVSLLKAITGRGLARAVGKVLMAIWGIKKKHTWKIWGPWGDLGIGSCVTAATRSKWNQEKWFYIFPFTLDQIGFLVCPAKFPFFRSMADMPGLGSALMRPLRMIAFRKSALVYWTQGFIWSSQSKQIV